MKKRIVALTLLVALLCGAPGAYAAEADASIIAPSSILVLEDGSFLLTDVYQHALWLQKPGAEPVRLAGRAVVRDAAGLPAGGYVDGAADRAAFHTPWAAAPYLEGYAVSDTGNHVLRYVSGGQVSTIAGSGKAGSTDATGAKASFDSPTGLVSDGSGGLYVADSGNHTIRHVDARGVVTTYAGGGEGCADGALSKAKFSQPTGLCWSDGVLYVADTGNHRICKIENGQVSTLAGSLDGTEGLTDGAAASARFSGPQGLTFDENNLYIADTGNGAVRVICGGQVTTLLRRDDSAQNRYPVMPRGLAAVGDALYVGDVFARVLFPVDLNPAAKFTDIAGHWAQADIKFVVARGLLDGTSATEFSPDAGITRGMLCTAMERLSGVTGCAGDEIVSPNQIITRQELAVLLRDNAKSMGYTLPQTGGTVTYADAASIGAFAKDAVEAMRLAGLMNGRGGDKFDPTGAATRAEASAVLRRYVELVVDGQTNVNNRD